MSLRRKISKVEPLTVIRSSLVFNPVASVAQPAAVSFSEVLVTAVSAPRTIGGSYAFHDELKAEGATHTATHTNNAPSTITTLAAFSPRQNNSTDLYTQLETLLREKSILLAVV